jgi:hypothetical protein
MLDAGIVESATPIFQLASRHGQRQMVKAGAELVEDIASICPMLNQSQQPSVGESA